MEALPVQLSGVLGSLGIGYPWFAVCQLSVSHFAICRPASCQLPSGRLPAGARITPNDSAMLKISFFKQRSLRVFASPSCISSLPSHRQMKKLSALLHTPSQCHHISSEFDAARGSRHGTGKQAKESSGPGASSMPASPPLTHSLATVCYPLRYCTHLTKLGVYLAGSVFSLSR